LFMRCLNLDAALFGTVIALTSSKSSNPNVRER
jgi:hypothetical protein